MCISKKQSKLLSLAANAAQNSTLKYRHGCIISKGNKVIAEGYNHERSSFNNQSFCSFHAEVDACKKAMSSLFGKKKPYCLL
jgi:deoxycytidylate deaminase